MQKVVTHPTVGEVTLSRTRRSRRITLSVRPDGAVRLSFPLWVTQRKALGFLDGKVEWVAAARHRMAERYPTLPSRKRAEDEALTPEQKQAYRKASEALRAEARATLPPMVARLAAGHGFRYGAVRVKLTKSRWGSCTVRNDINLSIALVALPTHLAEYIVLHELCHTVHKNHSAHFHALLDSVTGGHSKTLNAELRKYRPDAAIDGRINSTLQYIL